MIAAMALRLVVVALVAFLTVTTSASAATTHEVLVVGNNWEGTADVVDPRTFERLIRLNIIPDYDERVAEIMAEPPPPVTSPASACSSGRATTSTWTTPSPLTTDGC